MCDYSLGGLPNRLAVSGEELIVHRFSTHSIGFASPADLRTRTEEVAARDQNFWHRIWNFFALAPDFPDAPAVCVPPGACLILKYIPLDLQRKWSIGEEESVIFVQTSAEVNTYRDAVHFRDGREVLLQNLTEGMRVRVVSLDSDFVDVQEPALMVPNGPPVG